MNAPLTADERYDIRGISFARISVAAMAEVPELDECRIKRSQAETLPAAIDPPGKA